MLAIHIIGVLLCTRAFSKVCFQQVRSTVLFNMRNLLVRQLVRTLNLFRCAWTTLQAQYDAWEPS